MTLDSFGGPKVFESRRGPTAWKLSCTKNDLTERRTFRHWRMSWPFSSHRIRSLRRNMDLFEKILFVTKTRGYKSIFWSLRCCSARVFFPRWFDWRVRINAKGKWKRKIIFYRAGFVLLLFFLFFLSFLFHLKFLDLCLSWLGRESGRMRRLISSPERPRPPCRPRPKAGRRKIPRPRP